MGAAVGGVIPFGQNMPAGLIPAALAQGAPAATPPAAPAAAPKGPQYLQFPGKSDKLVVLGEKPLVAETPESLLDDDTTPTDKFFIRNNGLIPDQAKDADSWKLTVDGEVNNKLELTLGRAEIEVQAGDAPHGAGMRRQRPLVLHAAGARQSVDQWRRRLRGMDRRPGRRRAEGRGAEAVGRVQRALRLRSASLRRCHQTLAVARGADQEIDGRKQSDRLGDERPAAAEHPWLPACAWSMPGWPGSVSSKWLNRIWIRDKEHDGPGMGATSYRVAIKPMVPGDKPDEKNFKDLESMPVRSIITNPANGTKLPAGTKEVQLRGAAWAGDHTVKQVDVSTDFGANWTPAKLGNPKNKYDWQRWTASVKLPSDGYYEIWTRGMDSRGIMQPHIAGFWNPQGYGGNPMHRVAVLVG